MLIEFSLLFRRFCFREITRLHICRSCLWRSLTEPYCSHCVRIVVEALTLDGIVARYKHGNVNLRKERRKLFQLYRGKVVVRKRLLHEQRVLHSLGIELREAHP